MTTPAFDKCHAVTAKWEGTWSNDKRDPGGPTMGGVTQARYDEFRDQHHLKRQSVRQITRAEALEIFYQGYWLKAGCNLLFTGVDLAVYDAAVNSGPGRAIKWLARAAKLNDPAAKIKAICGARLSFVEGLRNFKVFGRGWSRRIADVLATGLAWALAAKHDAPIVREQLKDEASVKTRAASQNGTAGKIAAAPTAAEGGNIVLNPDHVAQVGDWLVYGLLAAGIALVLFFVWRRMINRHQAEALSVQAEAH